jgi:hypothetical protein
MGICVPKHVVCGWYEPVFVAGATGCTLPTDNTHPGNGLGVERKGRLEAGGAFFRSLEFGPQTNNINITSTWQVYDGGDWRDYIAGSDLFTDIIGVKLVVTDGVTTETYTADQTPIGVSPLVGWNGGSPTDAKSIDVIKQEVATSSSLIIMPDTDGIGNWPSNSPPDPDDPRDTATGLDEFSDTLKNGSGPNTDPSWLNTIRTGPVMTLVMVTDSEDANGNLVEDANVTRYWNGACWKSYDPTNPDCADPNNPPADCGLGPASDC